MGNFPTLPFVTSDAQQMTKSLKTKRSISKQKGFTIYNYLRDDFSNFYEILATVYYKVNVFLVERSKIPFKNRNQMKKRSVL